MRFKIGDRVKLRKDWWDKVRTSRLVCRNVEGKIGTVMYCYDHDIGIRWDNALNNGDKGCWWFYEDDLKLYRRNG